MKRKFCDLPVVFTNGCFDILHVGHVELLEFCSNHGYVIVGINSDESMKRIKRAPYNNENDRKKLLEAIRYVTEVIIFNEDTPYELIKEIAPDVLVKGGDYTIETIVGADIAKKTLIFPTKKGYSTTNALHHIGNRR